MTQEPYCLYGTEVSLYTGKARSYFRKKGIAFEERVPSHPRYGEHVLPKAGRRMLPTVEAPDGSIIQDTTEIIDFVEQRNPENSVYPTGPRQRLVALTFELYGDEGLLKPAMHYRWNFPDDNEPFIFREFGRSMSPTSPMDEAAEMVRPFAEHFRGFLPGLGVNADTVPAIEEAYLDLLDLLNDHFRLVPYLLGGRPCIGDFGLMGPLYAHLGRDPYPARLMRMRAPFVARWVERMNASDSGMAEFPDMEQDFLPDDAIPETLMPVLKLIVQDYFPEIVGIVNEVNKYVEENNPESGTPVIPEGERGFVSHTLKLRGTNITQVARPYSQWMFQRVLDCYQSFTGVDKESLDNLLKSFDGYDALQVSITRRINRVNNIEVFA